MTKEKLSLKRQLAHLVAAGTFIAANIACTISGSVNLGNKDTDSHNKALPTLTFTPTSTESPTPTVIVTRIPAPTSTPTVAEIMVATATASATASATETATSTATATENSPLPKRPNLAENKNHEGQADALGDGWSVDQYIALLNRDYAKIATGNLKDVPRDVQSDIMFSPWVAPEDVKLDHPEHFSLGLTDKALAASLAGIVEKGDEAHAHVVRVKTNNPDGSTGLENITLYEQPATDKQPALWIAGSIMTHTSEFSSTLPTSRAIIEQIVLENGKYDGNQGELAVKYLNHLGLLTSDKGRYELNPDGYLIYVAEESCQVLANPTEPLSAPLLTNHTIEDTSEGYQPLAEGKPVEWGKSDGTMQGVWQVAINKDGFDAWAAANPNATAVEREAAAETFTRAIRAEANYRADQVPAGYDKVFILNGVDYAFDKMDLFPCLN
ncbi:MAG TPA: hypothetical protein VFG51_03670, partial [Candidatus Saccharimonadia bacterium]|nr:hypothetical protein [Candidatus Saccharimonadia bacterium]